MKSICSKQYCPDNQGGGDILLKKKYLSAGVFILFPGLKSEVEKLKVFCCEFGLLFCFAYSCDSGHYILLKADKTKIHGKLPLK